MGFSPRGMLFFNLTHPVAVANSADLCYSPNHSVISRSECADGKH